METVTISVEVLTSTPGALLIYDGNVETWLPLSQVFNDDKRLIDKTPNIELRVAYWIAKKKGLI